MQSSHHAATALSVRALSDRTVRESNIRPLILYTADGGMAVPFPHYDLSSLARTGGDSNPITLRIETGTT
ncbi:hypothetical protein LA080_014779 [Diaporthe eres]|nr:hypothetical protein LA080_014779 [Diaporthe eres]